VSPGSKKGSGPPEKKAESGDAEDEKDSEGDAEQEDKPKGKQPPKPFVKGGEQEDDGTPPKEADEPATTDRMDEPEFYRDDLQAYYDMRIGAGDSQPAAVKAVKKRFGVKRVEVTPTGEVRSPGVIDDPDPPEPPAAAPPEDGDEPPPEGDEEEEQDAPPSPPPKEKAESVDELWLHYLDETEHPIPDFEQWVLDAHSELAEELTGWTYPIADKLSLRGAIEALEEGSRWEKLRERNAARNAAARYAKFNRLVNMRPHEIREHLRSGALRETLERTRRTKTEGIRLGIDAARKVMRLKALPIEEWVEGDWQWANRAMRYIERTLRNQGPLVTEDGRPTRKLLALRAWGHNPGAHTISESEVRELIEHDLVRVIDPHATGQPVQVVEKYDGRKRPRYHRLQKGRKKLSDEERSRCMGAKAVWHHGPQGQATPAVWKSVVDGDTWYVTNTHRAYNIASTLDGAIERYHSFIKSTA